MFNRVMKCYLPQTSNVMGCLVLSVFDRLLRVALHPVPELLYIFQAQLWVNFVCNSTRNLYTSKRQSIICYALVSRAESL